MTHAALYVRFQSMNLRLPPMRDIEMPLFVNGCRRAMVSALAAGIQMAFFGMAPGVAAEEAAEVLTDRQGRTLDVMVLAVEENQVRVRRQSDGREFSIPTDTLSEASRERLRDFKNPEPSASEPQESVAKPPVEISIPNKVLSHFRGKWESAKRGIPNIGDPAAIFTSQQLSMLIALENELVAAASPKDPAAAIDWPDGVAQDIRGDVEEVRQNIRDVERKRIFGAAGEDLETRTNRRSRNSDPERLNDLYERAAKSWRAERNKAYISLAREQKSSRPDKDAIATLKEKANSAGEAIASIHKAVYGFGVGEWLAQDPGWLADHEAEILRKEISTLRNAIHDRLIKAADHAGEEEYKSAEIDGVSIYSSNFGVILDISGSMTEHIDPLKEEIGKGFQSPLYREVTGCSLQVAQGGAARLADTLSCIEEMILVYKVDTIYWFCDLRDPRDEAALMRLGDLLRMGDVRFYVRSVGLDPDRELKALMDEF